MSNVVPSIFRSSGRPGLAGRGSDSSKCDPRVSFSCSCPVYLSRLRPLREFEVEDETLGWARLDRRRRGDYSEYRGNYPAED